MGFMMTETTPASDEIWSRLDQRLKETDEDRWLSSRFEPVERRNWIVALYAFEYELARVPHVVSEEMLGRIRYQWWRETVEGIGAWIEGGAPPRAHDVTAALAETVRATGLPPSRLLKVIDSYEGAFLEGAPAGVGQRLLVEGVLQVLVGDDAQMNPEITRLLDAVFGDGLETKDRFGPLPEAAMGALAHFRLLRLDTPGPLKKRFSLLRAVQTRQI